MKKTVDLGETPNSTAEPMPSKSEGKPYFPCLYITGSRVSDMPAEGTATITYKLKRSTADYTEGGKDSVEIEVQDITYNSVDESSMEEDEPKPIEGKIVETEEESEEYEEESPAKPMKNFNLGKNVRIDSSKKKKE
jgi:hypothetical protein